MPANYKQGKWFPRNPNKYRGDINNIIFRSSWEKRFFEWCDINPAVIEYSSEEVIIPYFCQTDGKWHRYFVDAYIKIKDKDGNIKSFLVEIKPFKETIPPQFPGKQTKKYLTEVATFIKNQSKWKAAKQYAESRGLQFIILTEKDLGIGFESKNKQKKK